MKRLLLLMAVAAVVLLVPTEASACEWYCPGAFGDCQYDRFAYSYCSGGGGCVMWPCRTSSPDQPELLSAKYQIASVEIEYRNPADTRDNEVRVAAKSDPEPVKKTSVE
jgi:hypothetical protein